MLWRLESRVGARPWNGQPSSSTGEWMIGQNIFISTTTSLDNTYQSYHTPHTLHYEAGLFTLLRSTYYFIFEVLKKREYLYFINRQSEGVSVDATIPPSSALLLELRSPTHSRFCRFLSVNFGNYILKAGICIPAGGRPGHTGCITSNTIPQHPASTSQSSNNEDSGSVVVWYII